MNKAQNKIGHEMSEKRGSTSLVSSVIHTKLRVVSSAMGHILYSWKFSFFLFSKYVNEYCESIDIFSKLLKGINERLGLKTLMGDGMKGWD